MNLSVFLILPVNYGEATVSLVETLNRYGIIKHYYESFFDPKVLQQPDQLLQLHRAYKHTWSILHSSALCLWVGSDEREAAPRLTVRRFAKI